MGSSQLVNLRNEQANTLEKVAFQTNLVMVSICAVTKISVNCKPGVLPIAGTMGKLRQNYTNPKLSLFLPFDSYWQTF